MSKLLTVLAASVFTLASWQINAGDATTAGGADATTTTDESNATTTGGANATTDETNATTTGGADATTTGGAVDSGPPAQQQKDVVPDSTSTGDYLEPQQDDSGATQDTTAKHKNGDQNENTLNKDKEGAKATNIEKSKRMTEEPEEGGTDVRP